MTIRTLLSLIALASIACSGGCTITGAQARRPISGNVRIETKYWPVADIVYDGAHYYFLDAPVCEEACPEGFIRVRSFYDDRGCTHTFDESPSQYEGLMQKRKLSSKEKARAGMHGKIEQDPDVIPLELAQPTN